MDVTDKNQINEISILNFLKIVDNLINLSDRSLSRRTFVLKSLKVGHQNHMEGGMLEDKVLIIININFNFKVKVSRCYW